MLSLELASAAWHQGTRVQDLRERQAVVQKAVQEPVADRERHNRTRQPLTIDPAAAQATLCFDTFG